VVRACHSVNPCDCKKMGPRGSQSLSSCCNEVGENFHSSSEPASCHQRQNIYYKRIIAYNRPGSCCCGVLCYLLLYIRQTFLVWFGKRFWRVYESKTFENCSPINSEYFEPMSMVKEQLPSTYKCWCRACFRGSVNDDVINVTNPKEAKMTRSDSVPKTPY